MRGHLRLQPDSSFALAYTIQYTKGTLNGRVQPGSTYGYEIAGTYSVRGDSITYRFQLEGTPPLAGTLGIADSRTLSAPTNGSPVATFTRE